MGSLGERVGESLGALRDVFRNPRLRRVQLAFAGQVVGQYAYSIAVAVYAYRQGGAPAVGIVAFVRLLAAASVAPFAAVLADRHRRERVMLASDLLRAGLVAAAGAVVLADGPALAVYALATVTTIAGTAFRPAEAALMPALARTPAELTAANVSSSTFDSLGSFLGPALGGILLAVASPGWVFIAMAACFLWSASFVARVRGPVPTRAAAHAAGGLAEASAGFRAIAGEPRLRLLIGLYGAQAFVAGALAVLVVVTALDLLAMGNAGVGFLESASGIGSLVGAGVALALITRKRLAGDFGLGIVLWGAPLVLLGVWPNVPVALVALAVVGLGNTLVDISAMTLLQRTAPEEVAGRVFGVLESVLVGAIGLGSVAAPLLISLTSPRAALVATGALLPVLAALQWGRLAEIDAAGAEAVPDERVEALRRIPIFAPLPLRTLELLASRLKEVGVPQGSTLFVRGESGGHFYVVVDGELDVLLDGEAKVVRDYVGEIALLRGVPRTATVRARTDTTLWALGREDFLAAVTGHPGAAEAANEIVGARLGYAPTA
jgi:MFS family permease